MEEKEYFCFDDRQSENLTFNLKNKLLVLWYRKKLIGLTFIIVFCIMILLTFMTKKVYTVNADLYINKSNSSNLTTINPYFIDEFGGLSITSGFDKAIMNEIELMQSALVINKVIIDNDLKYKKFLGIFPTKKTGQYITTEKLVKNIKITSKKNTNVVTISYKNKDRELAYNVVNSIILNYIELQKELNTKKSQSDKKIIEAEYNKAKQNFNEKIKDINGIPATTMAGVGNLAAMSAFSNSARQAMSTLQGQLVAGEKSQLTIKEESQKVAELSSKLEWAKLVDEMSDSSKVLVIKEPRLLKDYEQTSPNLMINILLGIIFGLFSSLLAIIIAENIDKKLCYSLIADEVIYDIQKEYLEFKTCLCNNYNKKIGFIFFENISNDLADKLKEFLNVKYIKADITNEFKNSIADVDKIVLFEKINQTDAKLYKLVRQMIDDSQKDIIIEVLL